MCKIKLGIIGMGVMGTKYANMLVDSKIDGAELTAIYTSRVSEIKDIYGESVAVFNDLEMLYNSGLVDGVIITTPHYYHVEMAILALEKNIHVLCEKPAGVNTREVRLLNSVAARSNVVFAMMFNQRTNSLYKYLKSLLDSGEMGEMRRSSFIATSWYRTDAYYRSSDWRGTWNGEGGGVLINQCPHNLDLWQWICGMPKSVQAFCHEGKWHKKLEVEDDVTAYVEYENGATGTFITSTGEYPGSSRLEISMDKGKILCENGKIIKYMLDESLSDFTGVEGDLFSSPKFTVEEVELMEENPQHIGIINNFVNAISRGEELVADGSEGIKSLEISNAMYLSSWIGEKIKLPIDEEIFLNEFNKKIK